MVWKITGDFTNGNIAQFINKLNDRFKVIYQNETMYVMIKSYRNEMIFYDETDYDSHETLEEVTERLTKELRESIFVPMGDFWVKLLRKNQWNKEGDFVKSWIEGYIGKIEQEIIEITKQKELIELNNDLDAWEKRLQLAKESEKFKEDKKLKEKEETEDV